MIKVLSSCFIFLVVACATPNPVKITAPAISFLPSNYDVGADKACKPIINGYQEILKGLMANDSAYIFTTSRTLIQLTDSLIQNQLQDSLQLKPFYMGISNVNAELEGLLAAEDIYEMRLSVNMLSLQLLHMLGEIGFKENKVYIFTVPDEEITDGLNWLSLQKKMRDPYHPNNKKEIKADQVLQDF